MSVPKSKRSEGQLTVLVKANELATYTIKICSNEENFPKHYRWCITNKIVDSALDINNYITMTKAEVDTCYEAWKAHATGRGKNKHKDQKNKPLKRHTHKLVLEMDRYYKKLWEEI